MTFEDIVKKFIDNQCYLSNGANLLSKKWGIDKEDIKAARKKARGILENKKKYGTEYNPKDVAFTKKSLNEIFGIDSDIISEKIPRKENKNAQGKLKSRWQSGDKWLESYSFAEQKDTIDFDNILKKVFQDTDLQEQKLYQADNSGTYNASLYLADQHIGASVENALYSNYFDKTIYRDRMNTVDLQIGAKSRLYGRFDTLSVFFLGDTFDGQDGFTVKRTHALPQNMSNSEAFEVGLYTNKVFLERLFKSKYAAHYRVYFVRESNHGGDMDLYLFKALKMWIETVYPQVKVVIAHKFMDHCTIGNNTFIYTHGKDNTDMKHGLPLVLDSKTEIFINQYIYENNIRGNISVVKGDLHQDATTNGKLFRYRNVPSLFGSSKWIMSNYGLTKPGVGYDIFNDKEVNSGVIEL